MADLERGIRLADTAARDDLTVFAERARRLDEAAVIRVRRRGGPYIAAWTATGFDVLAGRSVRGEVRPTDLSAGADELVRVLHDARRDADDGWLNPGFPMDSAWRGALPPAYGFTHLDDVPARAVLDLAERGGALAREHTGAHGPPASLLDSEVLRVTGEARPGGPPDHSADDSDDRSADDSDDRSVGIPLRAVFALTAMGFLPRTSAQVGAAEIVRVRVTPAWLRIDARYGSVFRRRGDPLLLT